MAHDSREALLLELDRLRARLAALEGQGTGLASDDHIRWLLETLRVVPWEVPFPPGDDEVACFRSVGPQAEALLGYPVEQWYQPGFWEDHLHPDDRDAAIAFCREETRQGRDHTFEYRLVAADGRAVWVLDVVRLIRVAGRPVAARGFLLDVTAQKQGEQSLRQAREWLTLALEAADTFCYRFDLGSGEVAFSGDPARFHGAPPGVTASTAEQTLSLVHPDDRPAVQAAWQQARAGGQMRVEYRGAWPAADGGPAWFHSRARLLGDTAGRANVLVGITADVTARRREEARRQRLEEQAFQAQKLESLGVLAGGVAHEFNNLLTTIQGYADLARADLPPGTTHGYLGEVLAATRRAADLTQQILAYAGKGRFVLQPLSLADLVTQMSPLLAAAVSRKARLVLDTLAPTPAIEGDAGQLRQVIVNLVTNASEALGPNGGTITLRLGQTEEGAAEQPARRFALIEVSDTGVGMDEATQARIFEPFFTTKFTGRGLGLAAVLGIVRGHGGQIRVESAQGVGSTFRVLLPASERTAEAGGSAATARPGLLLLVDDEDGVRNLASLVLQQAGYDVAAASDGQEGLERFRRSPEAFAGALLDLTMPRMDGLELLAQLRQLRPDLPVVLMTGYSAEEAAYRAGTANGTLQKPFAAAALIEVVRRALAGRG